MANTGKFVWYEHLTPDPDPDRSIGFYGEVVGWTTQPFGDGGYTMLVSAQGPLGGVMKLPAEAAGAPARWMGHVEVEDVDAAAAKAVALGGPITHPPTDIPTIGRFAVVADPQGGVISLFTPGGPMALHDASKEGEICWNELVTTDDAGALAFYTELLGWKVLQTMDMGPMGTYSIYGVGETWLGGIMKSPPQAQLPATWFFYAETPDLEAAMGRATRQGATVVHGPADVPGGRMVQLVDPQGAAFALHTAKPQA